MARTLEKDLAIHEAEIVSAYLAGEEQGEANVMAKGMEQGEAKGSDEGKAEERIEIAKSMLVDGFQPELMSKLTGLSL